MSYIHGEIMAGERLSKKEYLRQKIHDTADELREYVDMLMSDVDEAVSEADNEETSTEMMEEIYNALHKATNVQWQGIVW